MFTNQIIRVDVPLFAFYEHVLKNRHIKLESSIFMENYGNPVERTDDKHPLRYKYNGRRLVA